MSGRVGARYSAKVKLGIKAMTMVESLIDWEVIVTDQESECHLTLVRGYFILLNKIPASTMELPE